MSGRVLVTGAGGFIGRCVVADLARRGYRVRAVSTATKFGDLESVEHRRPSVRSGEIGWEGATEDVDTVIHLAARAHVTRETSTHPLEEFRRANVHATLRLARQAIEDGVRRFVFVSSIGVNGNATYGEAFTEESLPAPVEPYAVSKWEAEQELWSLASNSGLGLTVVRLPLVYGAGVKGNFLRLLRLVESGLPLPLGSVRNLRSYACLDNVVDFLARCVSDVRASGRLFLLADGEDVSTPQLLRVMAEAMRRPSRVVPFPVNVVRTIAKLAGRAGEFDRLAGSLQIDASRARAELGWTPPASFRSGINAMCASYAVSRAAAR